jgi:hypothetical protein
MLFTLAQNAAPTGLFAGMAGLMIVFVILAIIASIFWLWMLIDALTSNMDPMEKVLWFLVIFFLHLIGAIIYYAVKRSGGHSTHGGTPMTT